MVKIGVIGCGHISQKLSRTFRMMRNAGEEINLLACAARDLDKAEAFARAEGYERFYGSYEAMLQDPDVDLVYIGTPHSHHYEHMKLCLSHGKHVLCEKSFTINAQQAREVLDLAKQKGLLCAEAIWPRYMPSYPIIRELIKEIGGATYIASDLFYEMEHIERIVKPELAGGALLDIGIYAVTFARMYMGSDIVRVETCAQLTEQGVDRQSSIILFGENGCVAHLSSGICANAGQHTLIAGPRGSIVVDNVFDPMHVTVTVDGASRVVDMPEQFTGYEYEVRACMEAIRNGWTECPAMPHEEIVLVMKLMDDCREKWGMKYPQE